MSTILSIIIPVYNVEAYLDRCVKSIISQSYREFEIILIDDGSTDESSALCDKWAAEDSRILVIHKENGGVSSARNAGLEVAKGDYLTFVDPDDFIAPDTYAINMSYLLEHNHVDILQYPYCNYFDADDIRDYHKPSSDLYVGSEQIFRNWWSGTPLEYTACNKIYRRELWNDVRFNVGHVSEDTFLVSLFAIKVKAVFISEKGLYYYQRNRMNSYTYGEYTFDKNMDLFNAHAAIYDCFKQFPDMVTEKVLAFTRLYRRLITAKQTEPSANINSQLQLIKMLFPSWLDILKSRNTEKLWLFSAKVLGGKVFVNLFLRYLKK
ncbi:Glycosyl transferase family 2 [Xylanibacter ruminicola]|uniref:Glycosyl transferase family 2 n=1 Tax=Xylanibacter ruminicola TaxID=839 RepID=A0A1M7EJG3_XYLRU|nr:glycosyltransferase [Xylanibacter ruminicola]SHL91854.1 Glycosyl transferase family 2 [Xylanibacter ruminicola]